jgi:hypothetical protein
LLHLVLLLLLLLLYLPLLFFERLLAQLALFSTDKEFSALPIDSSTTTFSHYFGLPQTSLGNSTGFVLVHAPSRTKSFGHGHCSNGGDGAL